MDAYRTGKIRAQLVFLLALVALPARAGTLSDVKLYELTRFNRVEFSAFGGKELLLTFFQPDCAPCREQLTALKCLRERQPDVAILAVGIGAPPELVKEIRPLRLNFPAVESTASFLEKVGGVTGTPLTLFVDKAGEIIAKETSVRTCDQWKARVKS